MGQGTIDPRVLDRKKIARLEKALRAIAAGPPEGTTVMRYGQPESTDLEGSYMEDARYNYPARCQWFRETAEKALKSE